MISLEATLLIDVFTAIIAMLITSIIPISKPAINTPLENSYIKEIISGFSYLKTHRFITFSNNYSIFN